MVKPASFQWAKIASLKTYHRMDNILSQSTPCLAGLGWSDCRCQTTYHKRRIWSTLFSHTATCVGWQGVVRKGKRTVQSKDREERSMRERVRKGKDESSMSITLHNCELTGNHTANQPYSICKRTMKFERESVLKATSINNLSYKRESQESI